MMYSHVSWLWLAFSFGSLLTRTLAIYCNAGDPPNEFKIWSPEDLEQMYYCVTINGNIALMDGYQGPVKLPNTINVTGAIYTYQPNTSLPYSYDITTVEAPNLVHLGGLAFAGARALELVALPKLSTVTGTITIGSGGNYTAVDLGSLTSAGSVFLQGKFESLNLESLQHVDDYLAVEHSYGSYGPPVELSFPFLEFAGELHLRGLLYSLSVPRLASIGPSRRGNATGLWVENTSRYPSLWLSFPTLAYIDKPTIIWGGIESIHMPELQRVDEYISIVGSIRTAQFEKLHHFSQISVKSNSDFDCDSFRDRLIFTTGHRWATGYRYSTGHPDDGSQLNCSSIGSEGSMAEEDTEMETEPGNQTMEQPTIKLEQPGGLLPHGLSTTTKILIVEFSLFAVCFYIVRKRRASKLVEFPVLQPKDADVELSSLVAPTDK